MSASAGMLTELEVLDLLRISRRTLGRWRKRKRITAYRVGTRNIRYRRADVERLVQALPVAK